MTVLTSYESLQISQAHEHIQNSAAIPTQNICSNDFLKYSECCITNELDRMKVLDMTWAVIKL